MNWLKRLGQGGCGQVELYHDSPSNQLYAVKFMLKAWEQSNLKRFIREIKIMEKLKHPNIVPVLNYEVQNATPYYVMPYYMKGSLRDILKNLQKEGKLLPTKSSIAIIKIIANAMSYAHKNGAIHRDLKPENILFDGNNPVISDWGLGKDIHKYSVILTNGGLGTQGYTAPEQWNNGDSNEQADIYSLGIIFRELLTGTITGRIYDKELSIIVNNMTAQSPDERYKTMEAVIIAINNINSNPVPTDPTNDFWQGVAEATLVIGGTVIIGVVAATLLDALFKKK